MSRFRKAKYVLTIVLLIMCNAMYAQAVLEITPSNITTGVGVDGSVTNTFSVPSCLLGLQVTLTLSGKLTNDFTITPSILTAITTKVASIGGVSLLGSSSTYNLSQLYTSSGQTLYNGGLQLGSNSQAIVQYQIPQSSMAGYKWLAGTYTNTSFQYTISALLGLCSSTPTSSLTVKVDPFITFPAPSDVTLNINSFDYFRSSAISGTSTLNNTFTVPTGIQVEADASTFSYSNGYTGAPQPNSPASDVAVNISSPTGGPSILALSTGYQTISPSGGYAVPVGNSQTSTVAYSISPAKLKADFLQKGTYTLPLTYQAIDASSTPQASSVTAASNLVVNVADLGELTVNNPDVTLTLGNVNDYTNGVSNTVTGHLTLSKTTSYGVTVYASGNPADGNSNTLPLDCVSIGVSGGAADADAPVSLSTTPQNIITGGQPVVDRSVDITYSIPKAKMSELLSKPPGTYTTTIVYSLTEP